MPRERANERACDTAIRKTLAYRATFKYPLSYHQLYSTLITDKKFKKEFFDKELNKLVKTGTIGYRDGKYFDKRIKPVSWEFRSKQSKEALDKVHKVAKVLKSIPWIKMLAVTGSVAAYNSDKESDIDIFVVAKTHRLWLTRGFVAAILKAMNMYIRKDGDPGKICPNLFIDEEVFTWPEKDRSVFTAHEIVLMHPLINRDHTYFKFLRANSWVKSHFANFALHDEDIKTKSRQGSRIVNLFEKLAAAIQLKYMEKKRTNEVIDKHIIHFRKNDHTKWVLDSYKKLSK
jgi:predicted nucleotidyltransferase